MITFVSLFLSLMAGLQTVEVAVADEVARVELRLDGAVIGELTEAPWKIEHDFGRVLTPRRLEAVAFDGDGEEVGRELQLLNVPQPRTGASLIIEGEGKRRTARLSWATVEGQGPQEITVKVDGQPVSAADPKRIPLPALDDEEIHLVTAEIEFPGTDPPARAWATFGGVYGDQSQAELTAVPIFVGEGKEVSAEDLHGKVLARGEPVEVVALEQTPADVLMVRSPTAREPLVRLGLGSNTPGSEIVAMDPMADLPRLLSRQDRFNILAAWTGEKPDDPDAPALFPMLINDRRLLVKGVPTILTRGFAPIPEKARFRIADAVAAAGRAVAASGRARAVVLVLSGKDEDASYFEPDQVRAYLQDLQVPLRIWHVKPRRGKKVNDSWGEATDISNEPHLRQALHDLRGDLDRQRMLWITGRHLPQEISLSGELSSGLALAH